MAEDELLPSLTVDNSTPLDNGMTLRDIRDNMIKHEGIADGWGGPHGITQLTGRTRMDSFNRYYKIFPSEEMSSLCSYVFIVRPDLNMAAAINADPYFNSIYNLYPDIISGLTQFSSSDVNVPYSHHFVPFLTDRILSYQVSDYSVKSYEFEQPFTGYKTSYAGNSNESKSGVTFDISFRESSGLMVTKYFDAWVRYIDAVTTGRIAGKSEYIQAKLKTGASIIDYATAVYLIKTKPDGEEIVYFHKSVGGFPTTVPHSNWSFAKDGAVDNTINIQFSGGFPESLKPRILVEFNYNSGVIVASDATTPHLIDRLTRSTLVPAKYGNPIVDVPYIVYDDSHDRPPAYRLKWLTADTN